MTDRKILTTICLLLALYVMFYGLARWRLCIVMAEHYDLEELHRTGRPVLVRYLVPGHDVRDDWRGRFKNSANPYIYKAMYPLVWVENKVRGTG